MEGNGYSYFQENNNEPLITYIYIYILSTIVIIIQGMVEWNSIKVSKKKESKISSFRKIPSIPFPRCNRSIRKNSPLNLIDLLYLEYFECKKLSELTIIFQNLWHFCRVRQMIQLNLLLTIWFQLFRNLGSHTNQLCLTDY